MMAHTHGMAESTHTCLAATSVRRYHGRVDEAYEQARSIHEPVFVPAAVFADDRGWSLMNLMQHVLRPQGQLNFSLMYPQVIKAWHRHERQADFWLCVMGMMKAGVYRESDGTAWQVVMGERQPGVLIIPPQLWHGAATVGPSSAGLVYYVSEQYDAENPDEQRAPYDAFAGFHWQTQHQ